MNDSSTAGFVRVGGRLVIDLLNTVSASDGVPADLLDNPDDLPVWADVVRVPYARDIGLRSEAELTELREFREVLREGLRRWRDDSPASPDLIARLNRELARDPRHVRLGMQDG